MLHGGWWWNWNWALDVMTGGGRCQRRRKSMAGGRGTAESKKSDCNNNIPNLKAGITEKPLGSPKIRKVPPTSTVELDLYAQACKTLSFRSPFDSEDSQAPPAFVSSANTLPSGVSHLLNRHSDSRKRQKRLQSGSEKSSTSSGKRGGQIWIETEEYFRELNVEDIQRLEKIPSVGSCCDDKCFLIPSLKNDGSLRDRLVTSRGMLSEKDLLTQGNGIEANGNGSAEFNGTVVQEGPHSMDIDSDEVETKKLEVGEESSGAKRPINCKDSLPFSGVEWLLGSRTKFYLTTERPSKKQKLSGRDAGLEKLHVARPVEGLESVCHYCNYGDTGDPLNCLIKCSSCCMVVHQRCYGVQDNVDSSWFCSWCKWKQIVDLNTETPCLVCPKQGGALKPIKKRGFGSDDEGSKMEFTHLFCCQWMPELYVENTRTMEPIMNMDELMDTRRKSICYLCKVKYGACVQCSNGSCRTSFHPICAREARHRMEIWGNLGTDEVELCAYCSKHSEVEYDTGSQDTGDIPLTADQDLSKLNDVALDGEDLLDHNQKFETNTQSGHASHHITKCPVDGNESDAHACSSLNLTTILKKLVDLGKVHAKDLASEIGVSPDSLGTVLTNNHMVPKLRCKLLRWLKNHAHIGNLQKLKVKIGATVAPKPVADASEGVGTVSVKESSLSDAVPVKSVPPRRRTKSNIRPVKDDKSEEPMREDLNDPAGLDDGQEILFDPGKHQNNSASNSVKIEDELIALLRCLSEDGLFGEAGKCQRISTSSILTIGEVKHTSYIHPIIHRKLIQTKNDALEKTSSYHFAVLSGREASKLEASSTSGSCCHNYNLQATNEDQGDRCDGVHRDQLVKARNLCLLELSPVDEVEGELIYYQQRLVNNAATRKCISDELISKVVRNLTQEVDSARTRKWDDVLVSQYIHELREAKKQGRKERRHKEAQAVLAAATAAAAASSRVSSMRKDNLEESSRPELNKLVMSRSAVARSSFGSNSDSVRLASGDQPRTCDICRRTMTALNPIFVCESCKVAVHLDCYRSVRSTSGPWLCELCEDLFSSQNSEAVGANSWEKPNFVAECSLCGGGAGAFRKTVDGQWIHAFCAEWVLESTYRRGQLNPIDGMDRLSKGVDTCNVCRHKQGVCLKCSYGHCQTTFHPTCAKSADYYMNARTNGNGGKLQHKAYCEKHSGDQRLKAATRQGVDELKSLRQVRVELERLRLLCERIVKREKLKRDLVLCSHSILDSSRDTVISTLANHPYYQPEVSSESATTSIKGYMDGYKSGSEIVQRSDDVTVDSAVAGKRRVRLPISADHDQKTEDSTTSQNLYALKPVERVSFSGKHVPQRQMASRSPSDSVERQAKYRKPTETFEKELVMTSHQASMKNQRLPKGFVYVPIRRLSKDRETASPDAHCQEPSEQNG